MNKTAIKNFAIWARVQLIESAKQRAYEYEVTEDGENKTNVEAIGGRLLSNAEKDQRRQLITQIRQKGYTQVMEEAAYTWFNRFIALRFMEVNGYLTSKTRVFTDETGAFKPEIMKQAMSVELEGLDRNTVLKLIDSQANDELYKYLLITQCNALNASLPTMFETIANWTELLFPSNLLRPDSVLGHMVSDIPEEDWTDQVQIIGWLYQYYNTDLFNDIFNGEQQKQSLSAEQIPAATQLFTPDWSIRYMVENSLGRIFIDKRKKEGVFADGRGADEMTWEASEAKRIANEKYIAEQMGWKYYLPEAEQTQEVRLQLVEMQNKYANLDVKEIKVIDPCMGSGHILVYAFDVLMQIYEANGYSQRDAAQSILENNLYGLDIDDRAAQLAYFAIMMKARQYDRRIFSRGIQPHVYSIIESNGLDQSTIDYFTNNDSNLMKDFRTLVDEFRDAKEFGSILNIPELDFSPLFARIEEVREDISLFRKIVLDKIEPLIRIAQAMSLHYDVVVTNPPYLNSSRMDTKLTNYVIQNYEEGKADFATVMYLAMQRHYLKDDGYISFITTNSWMFLKSFIKVREESLNNLTFENIVDYGTELFDGKIGHLPIVAWVARKAQIKKRIPAIRLVEYCYSRRDEKYTEFFNPQNTFYATQDSFRVISGAPIVYWISDQALKNFLEAPQLIEYARPRVGQNTGDNDRFLRQWYEIAIAKIGFGVSHGELASTPYKWIPYNKGGNFRRWYGNFDYVVNWANDGKEIKEYAVIRNKGKHWSRYIQNIENLCNPGISWSDIAATRFGCRLLPEGFICDVKGSSMFPSGDMRYYLLAFLNSKLAIMYLQMLNPTTTFQVGNISSLPLVVKKADDVANITAHNVEFSKADWDSFETSWDFKRNPLV